MSTTKKRIKYEFMYTLILQILKFK